MSHRHITSGPGLPPSQSPISHAVVAGDHCYLSGQLSTDPSGRFQAGSARGEAAVAFNNLFAALQAAGFSRDDLVYVDVAFLDLSYLPEVNELFAELFAEGRRPARTVYQAAALTFGGRVKVQGVAVRQSAEAS